MQIVLHVEKQPNQSHTFRKGCSNFLLSYSLFVFWLSRPPLHRAVARETLSVTLIGAEGTEEMTHLSQTQQ